MSVLNKKCVVLYSGGLDSLLAVRIMTSLGFVIYPLFIKTPFYKKDIEYLKNQPALGHLDLSVVEDDKAYMEIVKHPQFGYGKNINPCIDCKIFFFEQARKFMNKTGSSFIVTGEVVGQRPMSQRSYSILRSIEKRAGLSDLVLRPLSAGCLPATSMEKEGLIDRDKLFCITGRSRKEQFDMAGRFGIEKFEPPAGGCLLTDKFFALRVKDMLQHNYLNRYEIELLTIGRHFRINEKKFAVSRNKDETDYLFDNFAGKLPFLQSHNSPGASGVFVEEPDENEVNTAASILKRYSKKAEAVEYVYKNVNRIIKPHNITEAEVELLKVKV